MLRKKECVFFSYLKNLIKHFAIKIYFMILRDSTNAEVIYNYLKLFYRVVAKLNGYFKLLPLSMEIYKLLIL